MSFILFLNIFSDIDLQSLLYGDESFSFLLEVVIRTMVMFLIILFSLRLLGKRSVTQLSVFELGVIIGLGSAAGDPMFYKDVGLLPCILAFLVIVLLYRFITFLINTSGTVEKVLEGEPAYVAENGKMNFENFEKELVAHEEFFSQLRFQQVTHLGQVKFAILETNGALSVIFYPDSEVRWGLPVLPHICKTSSTSINSNSVFACSYCGQTEEINQDSSDHACPVCKKNEWVKAMNELRVG